MFTGIIEATALVKKCEDQRLVLESPESFDDIKIGSSIAVSGVCLSVVSFDADTMTFDVVETTLHKTKLGSLKKGDRVNLERAMRADGRFEGHIVQGHCEGVGRVLPSPLTPLPQGEGKHMNSTLQIHLPPSLLPFIVSEGSITIDGVSLTVAKLDGDQMTVALIPHTLENTTLGSLKEGNAVNIETDVLAKYSMARG